MKKNSLRYLLTSMVFLSCLMAYGAETVTVDPYTKSEVADDGRVGNPNPNRLDCTYYYPGEGRWVVVSEYNLQNYKNKAATLAGATLEFGFGSMWGNLGQLRVMQIPCDLQVDAGDYGSTVLGFVVQETGASGTPSSFSVDVTNQVQAILWNAESSPGIAFRFDDSLVGDPPDGIWYGGGGINTPKLILRFSAATVAAVSPTAKEEVEETGTVGNANPDRQDCTYYYPGEGRWVVVSEFDIQSYRPEASKLAKATLDFGFSGIWGNLGQLRVMEIPSDLQVTAADYGSGNLGFIVNEDGTVGTPSIFSVDVTAKVQAALATAGPAQGIAFRFDDSLIGDPPEEVWYGGGGISKPTLILEFSRTSHGHQLLLDKGLQIQAWAFPEVTHSFNQARWNESNFTTLNTWYFPYSDLSYLPAAPGIPWSRVVGDGTGLVGGETPFIPNLVSLQVDDEQDLTEANIATIATHMDVLKSTYPTAIIHANQWGSQSTVAQLQSYMQQARPDMLMFDTYPFDGSIPGGSPTTLYEHMQKYRLLGLAGNDGTGTMPIPYALFTQTYIRSGHSPSDSEMRLNEFAAWAYGFKMVSAFVYETVAQFGHGETTSLFSSVGDTNPTSHFYELAETNRQSKNLGPALIRLLSTDVRMIMGQYWGKENWWESNHTIDNTPPVGVTAGIAGADPYLTGVTATNIGSKNNGKRGDLIVGFFKVLDERFDGPAGDQTYFMVVNGLSDASGTAAETRQRITLNFSFSASEITGLQRLNRDTGQLETVALISDGGSVYHLDLDLDGGTGDLFKYNTGAPFVGVTPPISPVLSVTPDSQPVDYQTGTTSFVVNNIGPGTMPWSAEVIEGNWLSIPPGTGGTNSGTIPVSFTENTDQVNGRTGKIRITATGAIGSVKEVTVVQAAAPSPNSTVHGTVTYTDYPGYPLNTVTIEIRNGTTVVETHSALALTGSAGSKTYSFTTSLTGDYTLAIVKNVQTGWKESVQSGVTLAADTTVDFTVAHAIAGDASMDGKVDVSDLGILAANYGGTGKTWDLGDFSGDGKVDVSDLGILAANYGQGSGGATQAGDLPQDMKALGFSIGPDELPTIQEPTQKTETSAQDSPVAKSLGGCGNAGLPLIAGIFLAMLWLMGLKFKE